MNEEDTYFSFKYQGNNYLAFKNEGPYLQIVMICNTKSFAKSRLLEVCNEMNSNKFILKFVLNGDNVWCSYEFKPAEGTSSDDFDTILMLLDKASDEMFEKLG